MFRYRLCIDKLTKLGEDDVRRVERVSSSNLQSIDAGNSNIQKVTIVNQQYPLTVLYNGQEK